MVSFRRVSRQGASALRTVFIFSLSLSVACRSLSHIFSAEKFVEMYYLQF